MAGAISLEKEHKTEGGGNEGKREGRGKALLLGFERE